MPDVTSIGRTLVIAGAVLVVVGLALSFSDRVPWLGRLPGDIVVERKNFTVYVPIATSVIVSLLLTLVLWLVGRK